MNLLKTSICVQYRQQPGLYRLNWQIFLTFGLYLKYGLYKIPFFVQCFGLDRDSLDTVNNQSSVKFCFPTLFGYVIQSSKWKFEFTAPNQILEFILYYIYLHKNWKIYWSKQSFTGLGPEDRWPSRGLCITLCTSIDSHFLGFGKYQITISLNIIFIDIQHISQILLKDLWTSNTNFFITFDDTHI